MAMDNTGCLARNSYPKYEVSLLVATSRGIFFVARSFTLVKVERGDEQLKRTELPNMDMLNESGVFSIVLAVMLAFISTK